MHDHLETDYHDFIEAEGQRERDNIRRERFDRFVGAATAHEKRVEFPIHRGEQLWQVSVPLGRLGSMIALCGWTVANTIRDLYVDDTAVMAELEWLEALPELEMPEPSVFYRYARRVE
jgi:hypothetical protein